MGKPSAFAKLKQAEGRPASPSPPNPGGADAPAAGRARQASRVGRKTVIFYDVPQAVRALKQIGLDHERTLQDLMHEALDDLLVKYGRVPFGPR